MLLGVCECGEVVSAMSEKCGGVFRVPEWIINNFVGIHSHLSCPSDIEKSEIDCCVQEGNGIRNEKKNVC